MSGAPLVSVICLCYNHERFVKEALESVFAQQYPNLQVIVVDDASTDNSCEVIREVLREQPSAEFYSLKKNIGNCRAFNEGLARARGEFVIDFATDDVMLPEKIRQQTDLFATLDSTTGVVFTDAEYIDEHGRFIRRHFPTLLERKLIPEIYTGDIYAAILSRYFIPGPTMMTRRIVFEKLQGYDPDLAYEDFDFWVRSAREFRYAYLDVVSTKIRLSRDSMSNRLYEKGDLQLHSTYLVLRKALLLNKTAEENRVLKQRLHYEIRQSVLTGNFREADLFYGLRKEFGGQDLPTECWMLLRKLRISLKGIYRIYQRARSGW